MLRAQTGVLSGNKVLSPEASNPLLGQLRLAYWKPEQKDSKEGSNVTFKRVLSTHICCILKSATRAKQLDLNEADSHSKL